MKKSNWIIVADARRARIFHATDRISPLTEVKDMVDMKGRLPPHELESDRHGHAGGGDQHAAMSTPVDPKDQEAKRFAKEIAEEAERGLAEKHYDQLYLAAAPRFLGFLRDALSPNVTNAVAGDLNKDLSQLDSRQLQERLIEWM